ncbi:MAG: hypothetical protein RBR08_04015 [Desulforegulaceae bacterium]|nr:hypothetical protein [Desulforegulaceae bacterium]
MTDCMVFNHHSLPFDHSDYAKEAVPDFLKICIKAKNAGLKTILVDQSVDKSWFLIELAPGYYWKNWHDQNLKGKNRDMLRAFRSIATQSPFFNTEDINEGADVFEVSLNGCMDYSALSAAAWHDSPILSFSTRAPWTVSPLTVDISKMNLENGEIEEQKCEIQNFYNYFVFQKFLPELIEKRNQSLLSGKEVLLLFEEYYPGVVLCGKSEQQLNSWSGSLTILEQVKKSVSVLNDFALQWKSNEIKEFRIESLKNLGLPFKVSGESQTVRDNPKLRRDREFWLPSGKQEFFEMHIKMSAGYRLHFYPDNETCRIYVGYIGPHLRLR